MGSIDSVRFAEGLVRGVDEEPEAVVGISDGGAMVEVKIRGDGGRSEEYRRIGYNDILDVGWLELWLWLGFGLWSRD